jgi:hypothetical protein
MVRRFLELVLLHLQLLGPLVSVPVLNKLLLEEDLLLGLLNLETVPGLLPAVFVRLGV